MKYGRTMLNSVKDVANADINTTEGPIDWKSVPLYIQYGTMLL